MTNLKSCTLLLLTFALTTASFAHTNQNFDAAWQSFHQAYTSLNQTNEAFTGKITPHIDSLNQYKAWMQRTTKELSAAPVTQDNIEEAFHEYRILLRNDRTCSTAVLQTLQADLRAKLRELKTQLLVLKDIEKLNKTKTSKSSISHSVAEAERATEKSEELVLSYSHTLSASDICMTFANYDLILVAAETLAITKDSPTPMHLKNYLSNQPDKRDSKKEAHHYLEAIERSYTTNLEKGEVATSLMLLHRLEGNMAFGTAAVKKLSEADRVEIEGAKSRIRLKVGQASEVAQFPKLRGMIAMTRAKAARTYDLLTSVENETIRDNDQAAFIKVKKYCKALLNMQSGERYTPPMLKSVKDALEYDLKLSEALIQLKTLEKPQDDAPPGDHLPNRFEDLSF